MIGLIDVWVDGLKDGWIDGCIDRWMDGITNLMDGFQKCVSQHMIIMMKGGTT